MHPVYPLKEVRLDEPHKAWIGREVRDRLGRHLGHVKEVLVEERSVEQATAEDHDVRAWTARADFVLVGVETGLFGRVRAQHTVMLPVDAIQERDGHLVAEEDADEIRTALGA
ncbi:MAG TPA: hypothetical protein VK009_14995 [Chloroflexota bacterium]|nr:hypothetical protein [Chloroflexota bacterium]